MLQPTFIDGSAGRLFVMVRRPKSPESCPAVLVCPAFGDEMNKTRRMITETAKRLNDLGIGVVIPDPFGTGDSEGAFVQSSWRQWRDDLETSATWASSQGLMIRGLLGIRTGALLAAQIASALDAIQASVLWQPVAQGKTFVNQFLRLRIVANSVHKGVRETTESLRQSLDAGESVNVAGYALSKQVVADLDSLTLDVLASPALGRLKILEIKRTEPHVTTSTVALGTTSAAICAMPGEPYWASVETVCDERVVSMTVAHFGETLRDA